MKETNESFASPESERKITREEVVNAYRKFVEQGVTHPDDLDLENKDVSRA